MSSHGRPCDIKLISFDLDDTLWDNKPVIKRAVSASLALLQPHYHQQLPLTQAVLHAKQQLLNSQPELAWDLTALRQASYAQLLQTTGMDTATAHAIAATATAQFTRLRSQVAPFDDVLSLLPELAKRWPIAAISNGNCQLFELPIGEYFSFYISPLEARCAKPDPAIYHYAAAQAQVAPEHILHVGDCPINDIDGANAAGMQTAWCNRNGAAFTGSSQPHYEIHSLAELPQLLR